MRQALERADAGQPWSESLSVAPDQTAASVGAMLRCLMLATRDLEPSSIDCDRLPQGQRVHLHIEALRNLWLSDPAIVPADLAKLRDFLTCASNDALQSIDVIWDRHSRHITPLERVVLERLESHHGQLANDDPDVVRLVANRKAAAAPETSLAGHVQRSLLNTGASPVPADDTLAVLAVRDALTECEAAAAIIQHWLARDTSLSASDIGVIIPASSDYAAYLGETFAQAGIVASSLTAVAQRRNCGAEAVLHFLQCRRRPAPAMALASFYCLPVLCWPPEAGAALADSMMEGDFEPRLIRSFTARPAALFKLVRAASPATTAQLKDELRRFQSLLSDDDALSADVWEAKAQIAQLLGVLGNAADLAEPDWEKAIQFAASFQSLPPEKGPYFLGGVAVMQSFEAPTRRFRKLLVLGFNDGAYPATPASNPFFLGSEVALIADEIGLELPSQASQLDAALSLFRRQLGAASDQVIMLLSERDGNGAPLAASSSLPLVARLVHGVDEPHKLVQSINRSESSIWDRLINWQRRPEFESQSSPQIPDYYDLGLNLLALRQTADGALSPQSPSRLEKLLVSPMAWLLGELKIKNISWQPEALDNMLRGSLAHEVFERLFVPGFAHPDDAIIEARVPELLAERIRALAPFLQTTTWVVERNTLQAEIINAGKHWSMVLRSMNAEIVGNEFWLSGSLFDHPVHGKADCLLRLPNGQPIVVDYKKSSSGTRRKRLQRGWDLQVDLYRRMKVRVDERTLVGGDHIADTLSAWAKDPAVAYHTLNDGNVLLNGMLDVDSAQVEIITGDIAANALALIQTRFEALKIGRLETNTTADRNFFQQKASLGTYALDDSPLIASFTRADTMPSVSLMETSDD